MLPGFSLALREGLEAALIIGVVLATLRKLNRLELVPSAWIGTGGALAGSLILAVILNRLGIGFAGKSEQVFQGLTMLFAAGLLTWMIFWMRRQVGSWRGEIQAQVSRAALQKGFPAIALIAFLSVLREGIKIMIACIAIPAAANPFLDAAGIGLGLLVAVAVGWSVNLVIHRMNLGRFFTFTNAILVLFAAGLVSLAILQLNAAQWIPPIVENVWNLGSVISDQSIAGGVFQALVGYYSSPSLSAVLGYVGYYGILAILIRWFTARQAVRQAAQPVSPF